MGLQELSDDDLKREYAKWDLEVRRAGTWGSAMERAESNRQAVEFEIAKRKGKAA